MTARGVAYLPIFRDASDRRVFLALFEDVVMRLGWLCLAYCLMTTHYHLLVRTPKPNLSLGMHRLNSGYARTFNRRHGGRGHAFERRYGSVVVETDAHLLGVVRYLALNPVEAGIVEDPAAWPWSSYRFLVGRAPAPRFLSDQWVLELFARDPRDARRRLAAFVCDETEGAPTPWPLPGVPAPGA